MRGASISLGFKGQRSWRVDTGFIEHLGEATGVGRNWRGARGTRFPMIVIPG
jgi:hypothetical protein